MKSTKTILYFIFSISLFLNACIPTKQLKDNEFLLYNQNIKNNKSIDDDALEVFYRQKPNRKILYLPIMPYLYTYFLGKKKYEKQLVTDSIRLTKIEERFLIKIEEKRNKIAFLAEGSNYQPNSKKLNKDTTAIIKNIRKLRQKMNKKLFLVQERMENGNLLMNTVGEAPVLFDSTLASFAAEQMQTFLSYKGFLDADVNLEIIKNNKLISVNYIVNEGKPYLIDSINYQIKDSSLYELVTKNQQQTLLKKGEQFDQEVLEKERVRLTRFIQNNGYFGFSKNSITYLVDDTLKEHKVIIAETIKAPNKTENFKRLKIDEVHFYTDVDVNKSMEAAQSSFRGIYFIEKEKRFSKKVLNNKVFIRPDSLYSLQNTEDTQIALGRMDIFKFVNVLYDTTGGINKANIFTSPHPRYQYSLEGGLNVSQSAIPGPFVSLSLKKRNLLGGLEIFEIRLRGAIEAQAGVTEQQNFRGQEYGVNLSLSLPRILFPLRSKVKKSLSMLSPTTQLLGGFSFVERPEYTRFNVQNALNYRWRNRKDDIFNLSLIDLSVINTTRLDTLFQQRLEELFNQGSTLINSFDRSLVSSINASYTRSNNAFNIQSRRTNFFRIFLETGGTFFNLWNRTNIANDEKMLGLRYFRFLKGLIDLRYGWPVGKSAQFATRLSLGVAKPYGSGSQALPYEKYFFSGGSNSNRAWAARRVGPGSFTPDTLANGQFDYSFEQPGEIIFESSIELRRNLFSFVDGAIFADASNIWMLREDPTRPGSGFETDFWKELAIGLGGGIRLNFDFLLIRVDLGVKMYDPARPEGERYIGDNFKFRRPLGNPGQFTLNLGIGYPF